MKKRTIWMLLTLLGGIFLVSGGVGQELTAEQTKILLSRVLLLEDKEKTALSFLQKGTVLFALEPSETEPVPPADYLPAVAEKKEPELRNQTSYDINSNDLLARPLSFLPVKKGTSQVLIVHTHTSEGYSPEERTTNPEKNVTAIGSLIAEELEKQGIEVVHDKTVHDTDYNGSYGRCLETVERQLKQNPGICIVLDVHRDAAVLEDGQSLRVISETEQTPTGQIMLVVGTEEGGLTHPTWEQNLAFGLRIQQAMDGMYPGLARPLNLRKERFNQHLAPGMVIVEVAANGNSMEEAKEGAKKFAKSLCSVLK